MPAFMVHARRGRPYEYYPKCGRYPEYPSDFKLTTKFKSKTAVPCTNCPRLATNGRIVKVCGHILCQECGRACSDCMDEHCGRLGAGEVMFAPKTCTMFDSRPELGVSSSFQMPEIEIDEAFNHLPTYPNAVPLICELLGNSNLSEISLTLKYGFDELNRSLEIHQRRDVASGFDNSRLIQTRSVDEICGLLRQGEVPPPCNVWFVHEGTEFESAPLLYQTTVEVFKRMFPGPVWDHELFPDEILHFWDSFPTTDFMFQSFPIVDMFRNLVARQLEKESLMATAEDARAAFAALCHGDSRQLIRRYSYADPVREAIMVNLVHTSAGERTKLIDDIAELEIGQPVYRPLDYFNEGAHATFTATGEMFLAHDSDLASFLPLERRAEFVGFVDQHHYRANGHRQAKVRYNFAGGFGSAAAIEFAADKFGVHPYQVAETVNKLRSGDDKPDSIAVARKFLADLETAPPMIFESDDQLYLLADLQQVFQSDCYYGGLRFSKEAQAYAVEKFAIDATQVASVTDWLKGLCCVDLTHDAPELETEPSKCARSDA